MPPPARPAKRAPSAASTPTTPTKKAKTSSNSGHQSALTSFFTSPSSSLSKNRVNGNGNGDRDGDSIVNVIANANANGKQKSRLESLPSDVDYNLDSYDNDDDGLTQEERDARFAAQLAAQDAGISEQEFRARMQSDEELARRLHRQWDAAGYDDEHAAHSKSGSSTSAPLSEPVPAPARQPSRVPPPKPKPVDLAALDASIEAIPLGDDIFTFDPYDIDTSPWPTVPGAEDGGQQQPTTPYALLTRAFVLITATRSRLAITTLLTNLLRVVRAHDPASLLPTVYLVSNHIAPPYDGVELGLGGSIVNKAIKSVTGKSARFLKQVWDRTGDPGDVAFEAKRDVKALVRPSPITVQKLFSTLHAIAKSSGQGSAAQKLGHVTKLLVASRGEETRFLVRTFISHLRIQAVRTTIATSLARAFALVEQKGRDSLPASASASAPASEKERERAAQLLIHPDERRGLLANPVKPKDRTDPRRLDLMARLARAEKLVREVRARHPNFGVIVPALLSHGLAGLSAAVPLRIGTPISPMLGSITRSLDAMHLKLGSRAFVSEFKYDGQRVQIHAIYVPPHAGPDARRAVLQDTLPGSTATKCGKWAGKTGQVYVRLFSRHLEEMTEKYPDIADMVPILMGREDEEREEEQGDNDVGSKFFGAADRRHENGDSSAGAGTDVDAASKEKTGVVDEIADTQDGSVAGNKVDAAHDEAVPTGTKRTSAPVTSFIMDAEVVAMSLDGRLLPFQTLSNRSKKDVALDSIKVKVGVFAFDLMYLDGESLLKTSFRTRRRLLHSRFPTLAPKNPLIARFAYVKSCESTEADDVAAFFRLAQQQKCEGIMVKSLDHHWEVPPSAVPKAASTADNGIDVDRNADADVDEKTTGTDGQQSLEPECESRLEKLDDVMQDDDELEMNDDDDVVAGSSTLPLSEGSGGAKVGKGVNGRGKALLSTYEPDKRCESWLKVKKDYVDGVGDSLDLVPIGAWHGMGRKATWWSPILLSVYDRDRDVYVAVCKCISGFTDAFYKSLNQHFQEGNERCISSSSSSSSASLRAAAGGGFDDNNDGSSSKSPLSYTPFSGFEVESALVPDVWWKPDQVWEIRGADITISPNYTAALRLVHQHKGLSIRFPRFIKLRDDKSPTLATTPAQLANLYLQQLQDDPTLDGHGNENEDQDPDLLDDKGPRKKAVDDDFEF